MKKEWLEKIGRAIKTVVLSMANMDYQMESRESRSKRERRQKQKGEEN